MASEWGRKETIVWPSHSPVNSIGAVLMALACTFLFVWQGFRSETLLRRTYTSAYIESQVGALFHHSGSYRLICVGGSKRPPRYALPLDFVEEGHTTMPDGKIVPITLSELSAREGYRFFYAAAPKVYADASIHRWLRAAIFDGKGIVQDERPCVHPGGS